MTNGEFGDLVRGLSHTQLELPLRDDFFLDNLEADKERLNRIHRVTPKLARLLAGNEVLPDHFLHVPIRHGRAARALHGLLTSKEVCRGWTVQEHLGPPVVRGVLEGPTRLLTGVLLTPKAEIVGYIAQIKHDEEISPIIVVDTNRAGQEIMYLSRASERPIRSLCGYDLRQIELGLADLVIQNEIDPDCF